MLYAPVLNLPADPPAGYLEKDGHPLSVLPRRGKPLLRAPSTFTDSSRLEPSLVDNPESCWRLSCGTRIVLYFSSYGSSLSGSIGRYRGFVVFIEGDTFTRNVHSSMPDLRANKQGKGGNHRALLIGINYVGNGAAELKGCHNDVEQMREYITEHVSSAKMVFSTPNLPTA